MILPKAVDQCEKGKAFRTESCRVPALKMSPPKRPRKESQRGDENITETGVVEFRKKEMIATVKSSRGSL